MNNEQKLNERKNVFSTRETILLVILSLIIGISMGMLLKRNSINIEDYKTDNKYLNEFIDNYEYIVNSYYKDIDEEKLVSSAIAGMMESLDDPYSMYFDESETDNFSATLDGSYEGVGIQVTKDDETGYMLITSVFKNSPAASANLIPGDMITEVDGNLAKDLSSSEFSSIIRNGKKDTYNLKIIRDNKEISVTLNKKVVTLTSVTSDIYEENDKKIGYIYIGVFASNTYEQFKTELENLEKQNIDYLILDVRGNTGGHLTAVDSILDLFLNKDQIMYQFNQNGNITKTYGKGSGTKDYEIVLLGDEVSASASEVLIAGIKENLGSKLIGKKTYGKGTVQELVKLPDGTQYKITVKKWLTPNGNWVNDSNGIVPDIDVDLDLKYYETYEASDDTQLEAALKYIKEK